MEWAVLEQVLASHWGCVTRTVICLASLELTVHMSICPIVSCSQFNQDDLVCSVQVVVAVCGVEVRVLFIPFSCCERLDDGLLIFVEDSVGLVDQECAPDLTEYYSFIHSACHSVSVKHTCVLARCWRLQRRNKTWTPSMSTCC